MNAYDKESNDLLLARIQELKNRIAVLTILNDRFKQEVADCRQTIEDVCIGVALECTRCGKPRPCLCQDS